MLTHSLKYTMTSQHVSARSNTCSHKTNLAALKLGTTVDNTLNWYLLSIHNSNLSGLLLHIIVSLRLVALLFHADKHDGDQHSDEEQSTKHDSSNLSCSWTVRSV